MVFAPALVRVAVVCVDASFYRSFLFVVLGTLGRRQLTRIFTQAIFQLPLSE